MTVALLPTTTTHRVRAVTAVLWAASANRVTKTALSATADRTLSASNVHRKFPTIRHVFHYQNAIYFESCLLLKMDISREDGGDYFVLYLKTVNLREKCKNSPQRRRHESIKSRSDTRCLYLD